MTTQQDLEAPLNPDLDYFDATPSIEALAEELRLMKNRMVQLEKLLQLQSGINGKLIENMNSVLLEKAEKNRSGLILPERLDS